MLDLSPCLRKDFQLPASCARLSEGGRGGGAALGLFAPLFAAVVFFCLFLAPKAGADVVIQSGDTVTRLQNNGAAGGETAQGMPENEIFGTGTLPSRTGQAQNDAGDSEKLPYGIVPEVHIPWRGGNWHAPGQAPGAEKDRKGTF